MTDKKPDDTHDEKKPVVAPADLKPAAPDGESEMERMRRTDPMFIEKTKPEGPSGRPGQLTRDNVNPNIPSGKRGEPAGPIVDPNTLGMPQGGVAPASPMKPENPTGAPHEKDRYDDLNKAKPEDRK
jgi:hypothetical protein